MAASLDQFITAQRFMNDARDDTVIVFRTRWIEDISTADRVVFDGETYDVKELKPIGRATGLDIRTLSTGMTP